LVKIKKQELNNKTGEITTNPQRQPGFYHWIFIGLLYFVIFSMGLFLSIFVRFDPIILFFSIVFLSLGILILYLLPKRYDQLSIDKKGVYLIRKRQKDFISFEEIENIAPLIKIDRSWYNISKYTGITIRKKGGKDRFIVVDPDEIDKVYYFYLKNAPNAIVKELKKIPQVLSKLQSQVRKGKIIKNLLIISSILISMILAVIFFPDYTSRGDYLHWSMKIVWGFIFGILISFGFIGFFGYFFGAEFDAKILAFKWRVSNLNNILERNGQDLFYVDKSSMYPLEKAIKTVLKEAGIIIIIFGIALPLISLNSFIYSGMSPGLIFPIVGASVIISLGYALLKKSKSYPIK
jgi:hypothetical protein